MQLKLDAYGIIKNGSSLFGWLLLLIAGFNFSCSSESKKQEVNTPREIEAPSASLQLVKAGYFVDGFDYPVGKPDAKGYYNAQIFRKNNHLGDDWNGTGGGNSDLGDPIYSVANGYVKFAKDIYGGWGKVIRIIHFWEDGRTCESFYAHCDTMEINMGTWVKRGDRIGTIGNADGAYYAHLHFEIRSDTSLDIGAGYDWDTTGYVNPTRFIEANRKIK